MSPIVISAIVLVCVLGGSLLGMFLRRALPDHHLTPDSKDLIRLGTGLIGTMAALILGLLLASAKTSYDTTRNELAQLAANVALLDRALAHYGPEAKESRELLRNAVRHVAGQLWSTDTDATMMSDIPSGSSEIIYDKIQELSPQNEAQRTIQTHALSMALDLGRARWLLFEQKGSSISGTFLAVLIFWFTIIFASFGLFAPRNATALVVLFICAVSLSGALFLILELDGPFNGLMQIPVVRMQKTLGHIGE